MVWKRRPRRSGRNRDSSRTSREEEAALHLLGGNEPQVQTQVRHAAEDDCSTPSVQNTQEPSTTTLCVEYIFINKLNCKVTVATELVRRRS